MNCGGRRLRKLILLFFILAGCREILPESPEVLRREILITYTGEIKGPCRGGVFTLTAALPQTRPGRQIVHALRCSPEPRLFTEAGTLYGEWTLTPDAPRKISFSVAADISIFPLHSLAQISPPKTPIAQQERNAALCGEKFLETAAPAIASLAQSIAGAPEDIFTVAAVYRAVLETLDYRGFSAEADGAAAALRRGQGDCTDFTDLFVALCRAKNIPARHISGLLTRWRDTPAHSWAEFYLPGKGWIPVDLLRGKLGKTSFGKFPAHYIYLSDVRNDPAFAGGMLYRWTLDAAADCTAALKLNVQ